ncbi:metallo-beta-lactamase domain protein [delta proteobacterium NaphS2]|nr:metallo-beta-lactamase domain protein [delta proteobacterium NaphS2]
MRNEKPGLIEPGLWCLGCRESTVYLLEGSHDMMLISGGTSYILPDVLDQLASFGLDISQITKSLILHAHFDHIGIIPYFKRKNPSITVYALERGWEILKMDKAISTINNFSRMTAERMDYAQRLRDYDCEWRHDVRGNVVKEGDKIDLGGRTVEIYETPGHSSCSLAAYVPELKALFPSDGGGVPFGHKISPAGSSNFTVYQQSLNKLADLEVSTLCADHFGYITGDEAATYIRRSIQSAADYRRQVEKIYQEERDQEKTVDRLMQMLIEEDPDHFLPLEIMAGVTRQVVKHIAAQM